MPMKNRSLNLSIFQYNILCHLLYWPATLAILIFLLFGSTAYAQSNVIKTLWTADTSTLTTGDQSRISSNTINAQIKKGMVQLAIETFSPQLTNHKETPSMPRISFKQRILSLQFFPEHDFRIHISSDIRNQSGALSLRGHLESHKVSTFTMTVTKQSFMITLQDLKDEAVYRVIGNTSTGLGHVSLIDLRSEPPRYDASPVISQE